MPIENMSDQMLKDNMRELEDHIINELGEDVDILSYKDYIIEMKRRDLI